LESIIVNNNIIIIGILILSFFQRPVRLKEFRGLAPKSVLGGLAPQSSFHRHACRLQEMEIL
jgi:hypothetical protein